MTYNLAVERVINSLVQETVTLMCDSFLAEGLVVRYAGGNFAISCKGIEVAIFNWRSVKSVSFNDDDITVKVTSCDFL